MTLRQQMEKDGYLFGLPREEIEKRIKTELSPESFTRFQALLARRPYTLDDLCSVPCNLAEAALLLSPMAQMALEANNSLYNAIEPVLKQGTLVADLGCGLGSFDRWLASQHPEVSVTAFDKHAGILAIADAAPGLPNLHFKQADYPKLSGHAFDLAFCTLGFEVDNGLPAPQEDNLEEDDPFYTDVAHTVATNALPAFQGWHAILKPSGQVIAILRVPVFEHLIGLIKGAYKANLALDLSKSSFVSILSVSHPVLTFKPAEQPMPDLDALIAWWVKGHPTSSDPKILSDAAALQRYRQLPNKRILDKQTTQYQDGHTMVQETGVSDETGFVYEYATTLYRRLELIPLEEIEKSSEHQFAVEE